MGNLSMEVCLAEALPWMNNNSNLENSSFIEKRGKKMESGNGQPGEKSSIPFPAFSTSVLQGICCLIADTGPSSIILSKTDCHPKDKIHHSSLIMLTSK